MRAVRDVPCNFHTVPRSCFENLCELLQHEFHMSRDITPPSGADFSHEPPQIIWKDR